MIYIGLSDYPDYSGDLAVNGGSRVNIYICLLVLTRLGM